MTPSEAGKLGNISPITKQFLLYRERVKLYDANPKSCKQCTKVISYDKKRNDFCNSSCSALYNNPTKNHNARMYNCIHCGTQKKRWHSGSNLYCNNTCRAEYNFAQKTKDILEGRGSSELVKKYLIKEHGEKCLSKKCAWDFEKFPIKVELEHIDGNSENNKLDNVTLLCPNCHSMTSTYKAKNKGNGRHLRRARYAAGKSY